MRRYIILFLLLIFSGVIMAEENATNIRVRQEGKNIVIVYDLSKKSMVRVLMASGNSSYFTELKAVSGNVGKGVPAGPSRKIVWHPLEEKGEFVAQNVRFKVEALSSYDYYTQNAKVKTLVLGQVGYSIAPQLSYGAMVGQMYRGLGWYLNFRSNFKSLPSPEYYVYGNEKGEINGEMPFYTGRKATEYFAVTGGFMINFLEWSAKNKFNTFGMYMGCGYVKKEIQWEMSGGKWMMYGFDSFDIFAANVGLFGSFSGVTFSVGLNSIDFDDFEYVEIEAGIGFMF